ncbi:MAG: leucine--tRNA ligase [bacterium]
MEKYQPKTIEKKWREFWEDERIFKVTEDRSLPKYYCLDMFPYPSGRIHMGHVRNYTIGDVISRYKKMKGCNVLHPMGWDAFGLPAENAAIANNSHPAAWTAGNIEYMRAQLKQLGYLYDWDREVTTCLPGYYRWEQLIFIRMYERGLAYKKLSPVNWCEACHTVLANEQVVEGLCWRCEGQVASREMSQWFLKITDYAEDLLKGLDTLVQGWPERVISMQRNWIGKSVGCEVDFGIVGSGEKLSVFTTRVDTIFGATFLSVAPDHPAVKQLIAGKKEEPAVLAFIEKIKSEETSTRAADTAEKKGVFTGSYALNPYNGEPVPVYVANFVLMGYGTGAVMAVPAHDQRDFEFARTYGIPVRAVVIPEQGLGEELTEAYTGDGILADSGTFSGLTNREGWEKMADWAEKQGFGKRQINYRLRDWGVSRQRYWGAPIPIVYCPRCGTVPEKQEHLPVVLPTDIAFKAGGRSPLPELEDFVKTACPACGGPADRETDTFDTFFESSWYFFRYPQNKTDEEAFDPGALAYWLPVDQYVGGIEHAILHLLYARFFTKVLKTLGMTEIEEPFTKLLNQGMVIKDGAKMSKSKGNVVDPEWLLDKYGADTARLFSLFAAPPEKDLEWNRKGVEGSFRFLSRVYRIVYNNRDRLDRRPVESADLDDASRKLLRKVHQTIGKVTADMENSFHFNTAIAAVMELTNEVYRYDSERSTGSPAGDRVLTAALCNMIVMLSPFAPHLCEELWEMIGEKESVLLQSWPDFDAELAKEESITIVVQINGKVRSRLSVPLDLADEEIREKALADDKIIQNIGEKTVRKLIVVPGKLVNIVVADKSY